ncbi:MAG TPA: ABC transporter substrate-binding protein, partial [Acidimicrobiales bacterium]|nr:ABC transporter substrate-binding protein [Acidimicrobiales bacterium]
MELEAWFDGEGPDGLAWHLSSCRSCFAHVEKMSRLRQAVRVGLGTMSPPPMPPVPAPSAMVTGRASDTASVPAGAPAGPENHRRHLLAVGVSVAVVLLAGLLVGVGRVQLHGRLSSSSATKGSSAGGAARHGGTTASTGSAEASAPPAVSSAEAGAGAPGNQSPGSNAPRVLFGLPGQSGALSLAVIVPTTGPDAALGAQITDAVERAVHEADAAGGVDGAPLQLTVVSAEDSAAVAALSGQVDAVVGGFGAPVPAGLPWILPADPYAAGTDVVATELSPQAAGERLGQQLLQRAASGTVGVVVGSGPDTALETGLAQEVPVSPVAMPANGACLPALASLQQQGVDAVAVAGSPAQASSCLTALADLAWSPPDGVLLAPSAAYAGVGSQGVVPTGSLYTVLGLPWPQSAGPGASQFRAAVPGVSSYQALVSYAAVEMAVQVARSAGALSMASLSAGTWQNDLYDFAGITNVGAQV